MKKIFFVYLILVSIFSYGKCCKKKKALSKNKTSPMVSVQDAVWMQYDETKCNNPWNFNWLIKPTENQIVAAVNSTLIGWEIPIKKFLSSYDKNLISCESCDCPNGRHYYVFVGKAGIEQLKSMKFYTITEPPQIIKEDKRK